MSADRIERFSALVASKPANPLFRFSLAQALDAAGRLAEAAEHYRFCAASRADWMMPRILLGKALLRLNPSADAAPAHAEARAVLEDALRLAIEQHHEEPEAELRALLASLPA